MLKIILILLTVQCFNKLDIIQKEYSKVLETNEDIYLDNLTNIESMSVKTNKNVYLTKTLKNIKKLKIEAKSFINSSNERTKLEEIIIKTDSFINKGYINAKRLTISSNYLLNEFDNSKIESDNLLIDTCKLVNEGEIKAKEGNIFSKIDESEITNSNLINITNLTIKNINLKNYDMIRGKVLIIANKFIENFKNINFESITIKAKKVENSSEGDNKGIFTEYLNINANKVINNAKSFIFIIGEKYTYSSIICSKFNNLGYISFDKNLNIISENVFINKIFSDKGTLTINSESLTIINGCRIANFKVESETFESQGALILDKFSVIADRFNVRRDILINDSADISVDEFLLDESIYLVALKKIVFNYKDEAREIRIKGEILSKEKLKFINISLKLDKEGTIAAPKIYCLLSKDSFINGTMTNKYTITADNLKAFLENDINGNYTKIIFSELDIVGRVISKNCEILYSNSESLGISNTGILSIKGNIESDELKLDLKKLNFNGLLNSNNIIIRSFATDIWKSNDVNPKIISNNPTLNLGSLNVSHFELVSSGDMNLRWQSDSPARVESGSFSEIASENVLLAANNLTVESESNCNLPFLVKASSISITSPEMIILNTYLDENKLAKLNRLYLKSNLIFLGNIYLDRSSNTNLNSSIDCKYLNFCSNFTSLTSNLDINCKSLLIDDKAKALLKNWNLDTLNIDLKGEMILTGDLFDLDLSKYTFKHFHKLTYKRTLDKLYPTLEFENKLKIERILEDSLISMPNVTISYLINKGKLLDEDFPNVKTEVKQIILNSDRINLTRWNNFLKYSDLYINTSYFNIASDEYHMKNLYLYSSSDSSLYINFKTEGTLKIELMNNFNDLRTFKITGFIEKVVSAKRGISIHSKGYHIESYVNFSTISNSEASDMFISYKIKSHLDNFETTSELKDESTMCVLYGSIPLKSEFGRLDISKIDPSRLESLIPKIDYTFVSDSSDSSDDENFSIYLNNRKKDHIPYKDESSYSNNRKRDYIPYKDESSYSRNKSNYFFKNYGKILCGNMNLEKFSLENYSNIVIYGDNFSVKNLYNNKGCRINAYCSIKVDSEIYNEGYIDSENDILCKKLVNNNLLSNKDSYKAEIYGRNLISYDLQNKSGRIFLRGWLKKTNSIENTYLASSEINNLKLDIKFAKNHVSSIFNEAAYEIKHLLNIKYLVFSDIESYSMYGSNIDILNEIFPNVEYCRIFPVIERTEFNVSYSDGKGKIILNIPKNVEMKLISCSSYIKGLDLLVYNFHKYINEFRFELDYKRYETPKPIISFIEGLEDVNLDNIKDEGSIGYVPFSKPDDNIHLNNSKEMPIRIIDDSFNILNENQDYIHELNKLATSVRENPTSNEDLFMRGIGFKDQKIISTFELPIKLVMGHYNNQGFRYPISVQAIYMQDMLRRIGQFYLLSESYNKVHEYLLALYEPILWIRELRDINPDKNMPHQIEEILLNEDYKNALTYVYNHRKNIASYPDREEHKRSFENVLKVSKLIKQNPESRSINITQSEIDRFRLEKNAGIFFEVKLENGKEYLFPRLITSNDFERRRKLQTGYISHSDVVVLLEGLGKKDGSYMSKIKCHLEKEGFYVIDDISYDEKCRELLRREDKKEDAINEALNENQNHLNMLIKIENQSNVVYKKLRSKLENGLMRKEDEIILIGHSQGGLRAFQTFLQYPELNIKKIISIATPWNGATILNNIDPLIQDLRKIGIALFSLRSLPLVGSKAENGLQGINNFLKVISDFSSCVSSLQMNTNSDFIKTLQDNFNKLFNKQITKELSIINIIAHDQDISKLIDSPRTPLNFSFFSSLVGSMTFDTIPDIVNRLNNITRPNEEIEQNEDIPFDYYSNDIILNMKDQDILFNSSRFKNRSHLNKTIKIGNLNLTSFTVKGIHDLNEDKDKDSMYCIFENDIIYNRVDTISHILSSCKK